MGYVNHNLKCLSICSHVTEFSFQDVEGEREFDGGPPTQMNATRKKWNEILRSSNWSETYIRGK